MHLFCAEKLPPTFPTLALSRENNYDTKLEDKNVVHVLSTFEDKNRKIFVIFLLKFHCIGISIGGAKKIYIAIFSTTNTKKHVAIVKKNLKNLVVELQGIAKDGYAW